MFNRFLHKGIDPSKAVNVKFCADIRDKECSLLEGTLEELIAIGAKDIRILLSSGGGNVDRGIELHNVLKSLPAELSTHNIGTVDSITNVIFLAGKKRYATPNARFMMHGVSRVIKAGASGTVSLGEQELREYLEYVQRDHKRIAETIARHSNMTVAKAMKAMRSGDNLYMPDEAKKLGFVHEIKDIEPVQAGNLIDVIGQMEL